MAKILLSLTAALKGGKKGLDKLEWLPVMREAFNNIKVTLMQSVCPAFPSDTAKLSLSTKASPTHVGVVLQHREKATADWRPLWAFTVWTDHKPLMYSLSRVSDCWTACQQ